MTKREFVEQWVLKHASTETSQDMLRSIIHNANFVWDVIGAEIPPEPEPEPEHRTLANWLFGSQ